MRALFLSWAWGSHLQPMVPFGWALRAAGHEVLVASHPFFAGTITRAGLPALPVGDDVDVRGLMAAAHRRSSLDRSAIRHRGEMAVATATTSAVAMAKDTYRFARDWRPDFVVFEPMAFLGPGLAADLDVPALRLLWATDFVASIADVGVADDAVLGGLGTRHELTGHRAFGDVTLDPCPPRLRTADGLARRPMRYVPYNGPAVLPGWLRTPPSRPRVVVTWGGSLHYLDWRNAFLAPRIVRALAGYDVEVVVAVLDEQRDRFTDLPGNVVHVGPVALHLLLGDCAAVIHQGGAATTMTAMSAGVPQLIFPWAADAIVNARYISAAGAGRYTLPADLDDAALAGAVRDFLDDLPGRQAAAAELHREHLALPSPVEVAAGIERDRERGTGPWRRGADQRPS
jgi:UDP:flavonoid glycosyltransferase YjiC (YdhE family)